MTTEKLSKTILGSEVVLRDATTDALLSTFASVASNSMASGTDNIAIGKGGCVAGSMGFTINAIDPERNVFYVDPANGAAKTEIEKLAGEKTTYSARVKSNYDFIGKVHGIVAEDSGPLSQLGLPVSCDYVPLYTGELPFSNDDAFQSNTGFWSQLKKQDDGTYTASLAVSEDSLKFLVEATGKPLRIGETFVYPPLCIQKPGDTQPVYAGRLKKFEYSGSSPYAVKLTLEDLKVEESDLTSCSFFGVCYSIPLGIESIDDVEKKIEETKNSEITGSEYREMLKIWLPSRPDVGPVPVCDANVAFGQDCVANGGYSFATGRKCKSPGKHSFAAGKSCKANAYCATAIGEACVAGGQFSTALGMTTEAADDRSFVWNGCYTGGVNKKSNGIGTFSVYPFGGINGFYIGDSDFVECVVQAVEKMTDAQKARLKSALGLS